MANYIFFVTRCTICRKPAEVEEEENSCIVSFRMDKKKCISYTLIACGNMAWPSQKCEKKSSKCARVYCHLKASSFVCLSVVDDDMK